MTSSDNTGRASQKTRRQNGRKANFAILLLALGSSFAGCASTPQPTAETGPFPASYREMAKVYLRKVLFDPYSVRDAEIAEPEVKQSIYLIDPAPGWTICVRLNAKNRMGAYTGLKEDALLVRGDRVAISLNELTQPTPTIGICRNAKWEPFPELQKTN